MSAALKPDPEFEDTRLRPHKLRNWTPKRWRVEYERIVAYSVLGWSNKMIAAQTGYTPVHVCNILQLDEAEHVRQNFLSKMRTATLEEAANIPKRLEKVSQQVVKRLEQLFEDDERFNNSPFAVVDRGIEVLKGLHHLKGAAAANGGGGTNIERAVIITGSAAANLSDGLTAANKALEINGSE